MANLITDYADPTIGLSVTPAGIANFNIPMILDDNANVPFDLSLRAITASDHATILTAASAAELWATEMWTQTKGGPSIAYVGRWAKVASAAYAVCPNATTVASVYAALTTTAKFELTEGVSSEDISPDFTGDTSMTDVATSITVGLAASVLGAAYVCTWNALLSRLTFTSDNTGASADAVSLGTPATGIDLTLAAYFGASFAQPGFDAEAQETALARILAVDNTPFAICETGGSIAQQVALSTAIQALNKFFFLVNIDNNAYSSSTNTDAGFLINALAHNQTAVSFTQHITQRPDAAHIGEILAYPEGSHQHNAWPILGLSLSGLHADGVTPIPMTTAQELELAASGYDWVVKPSNVTHFHNGKTANLTEIRVIIGKMFIEAKISESWYGIMVRNPVSGYTDGFIQQLKQAAVFWLDIAVERLLLLPGYTTNFPAASSFTAAVKATAIMDLPNMSSADVNVAVNKLTAGLNWAI